MNESPVEPQKSRNSIKLLVPIIVLLGAVVGLISALDLQAAFPSVGFGPPVPYRIFGAYEYLQYHIILTTISIALLIALIVVYAHSYAKTRANFLLGLLVVLFALLLQGLIQDPLIHLFINRTVEIDAFYSPVSDLFTIVAYSVFLYLSLE
ncbi:MAG: hypothetical protein JRN20_03935 [Nitrososphaerota archaeon]|nr:hypothetical protein [Nitrososphaerota archaeon]MDG6922055.1 hypothetical protein [Nitrososphaerota archaeon]